MTGPGDATGPVKFGDGILLRWNVGCGNVHAPHMTVLEHLEHSAQDGSMSRDLQFPVVGWRVTNKAGRIKRSYVVRVRPTATQLPVYPTRPTGTHVHPVTPSSVTPSVIRPTSTATDHFPAGWTEMSEPTWVSDGLQPSSQITGSAVHGRTTPLPPGHVSKPPVIGAAASNSGASSVSGASSSWLTVASSVLALTVVTLPTVDRTMRLTSTDEEASTTERRSTAQAGSSNDEDDPETWPAGNTVEPDAERLTETDRGGWTTTRRDMEAGNPITSSTVGNGSLSAAVSATAAFSDHLTTTVTATTSDALLQTAYQHTSPSRSSRTQISLTPTTRPMRVVRRRTRRPKVIPVTRRPPRKRTRAPRVDYAPVVRRRLDRIIVSVGDVLTHRVANDTFIDYQVSSGLFLYTVTRS